MICLNTIEEKIIDLSKDKDFLTKLKALSMYFDAVCGIYPEHRLEGYTIYNFAKNPSIDPDLNDFPENFDGYKNDMKNIIESSTLKNKSYFWLWDL